MKFFKFILILSLLLVFNISNAQEEKSEPTFEIFAYGGIGYTNVRTEKEPRYNLSVNTLEILFNYKVWGKYGIASGVGFAELSGSGFNRTGVFYAERNLIKIPVLITVREDITDKLFIIGNVGAYAQTVYKDRLEYINFGESDVYKGWNFGAQFEFGFGYNIDNYLTMGLNFSAQSDLSKIETASNKSITDMQKHKHLNTIGLFLQYKL